jgi:hypothetical protein
MRARLGTLWRTLFAERGELRLGDALLRTLRDRAWLLFVLLVAWGVLVRLDGWGDYWINPDEGLFYDVATASPQRAAATITRNANPPLYYHVLRSVAAAGGGVEWMRGLSLMAGVALLPLVFLIARRWGGAAAGVLATLLLVNAQGAVWLSQVIRPYALQFVFLALGLLFLFRFLDRRRPTDAAIFGMSWAVALLLHYSTVVFFGAAVAYTGVLALRRELQRRELLLLGGVFALLAALGLLLYVTHIAPHLQGSEIQAAAREGRLQAYFPSGFLEAVRNYMRFPNHAFGRPLSFAIPWLVPASLAFVGTGNRRQPMLIVLVAIAVAALLAILGQYPFGPTRHSTYLAVAMAPAAAVAMAGLLRSRRRTLAVCGLGCLLLALVTAFGNEARGRERIIPSEDAVAIARHLRETVSSGDLVLLDWQTFNLLIPMWTESPSPEWISGRPGVAGFTVDGRTYVVAFRWKLSAEAGRDDLLALLVKLVRSDDVAWDPGGRVVWLVQGGWGALLARDLPARLADGRPLRGEILGGPSLMAFRLHPESYLIYAARQVEPGSP